MFGSDCLGSLRTTVCGLVYVAECLQWNAYNIYSLLPDEGGPGVVDENGHQV